MARIPRGGTRTARVHWTRASEPAQPPEEKRREQVTHDLSRLLAQGAVRVVIGPSQEGDDDADDTRGSPPGLSRSRLPE